MCQRPVQDDFHQGQIPFLGWSEIFLSGAKLRNLSCVKNLKHVLNATLSDEINVFNYFLFCFKNHKSVDPTSSQVDKLKYLFLCPPHGHLANIITWTLVVVTLWAASYVVLGQVVILDNLFEYWYYAKNINKVL